MGAENSNLALPEESITKRRDEGRKGDEELAKTGALPRPLPYLNPQSSWCVILAEL